MHRSPIPCLSGYFDYWFEAGDASTEETACAVRACARPSVAAIRAVAYPPSYVGEEMIPLDVHRDRVTVLAGSKVVVTCDASDSVVSVAPPFALGAFAIRADVKAMESDALPIRLVDANGLSNASRQVWVDVRDDALPTVVVRSPATSIEVTPRAVVAIDAVVRDDVRIDEVQWTVAKNDEADRSFDWTDELSVEPESDEHVCVLQVKWAVASVGAAPGDLLKCRLAVRDAFELDGVRHAVVDSQEIQLLVVSEAQMASRVEREGRQLAGWVRQLMQRQERLLALIQDGVAEGDVATDRTRRWLDEQMVIRREVQTTAGQFGRLTQQARDNALSMADQQAAAMVQRLSQSQGRLDALTDANMRAAVEALNRAAVDAANAVDDVSSARRAQEASVRELRAILELFEAGRSRRDLVERARALLDEQEALTRRTGTSPALDSAARRELRDGDERENETLQMLAHDQRRLADDVERHARRMDDASDSFDAEAMRRAAGEVAESMRESAHAIGQQRRDDAMGAQHRAEDGLRRMIRDLAREDRRELAELSKQVVDVETRLKEMIAEEQALADDIEAGDSESLATRQHAIRMQSAQLAEAVGELDPSGRAAVLLHLARLSMEAVESSLANTDVASASAAAMEAVDRLRQTLAQVEARRRWLEQQLAKFALNEVVDGLTGARRKQATINEETVRIEGRREASMQDQDDGVARLSRSDSRGLSNITVMQREVVAEVARLESLLAGAAVSIWAMSDLKTRVDRLVSLLVERRTDLEVQDEQADALLRMDVLIAALAAERDRERNDDGNPGGGGGGSGMMAGEVAPMPRLAELRLLRALQADLQRRTRRFYGTHPAETMREADLAVLERLGAEQLDLRTLAANVLGTQEVSR